MAVRRGMAALLASRQASTGGGAGNVNRRFSLRNDKESAVVRFFGDFEGGMAPVLYARHYIKRLAKGKQYANCGQNADPVVGCEYCYVRDKGDKGIGMASDVAGFELEDRRKFHRFDQEVLEMKPGFTAAPGRPPPPNSSVMTRYPWCTATKARPCQWCKMGNEATSKGMCFWELSTSHSDGVTMLHSAAREYCACGAREEDNATTLAATSYQCGHCAEEVAYEPAHGNPVAPCTSCGQTLPPTEVLSCTECATPARSQLGDFLVRVTRMGIDTNTSYNFELLARTPVTPEELEASKMYAPNWDEITRPDPPEVQAGLLGIPASHFKTKGHGAVPYAQPAALPPRGAVTPQGKPFARPVPMAPKPAGFKVPMRPKPVQTIEVDDIDFGEDEVAE